ELSMTHPTADELLLLTYDELPAARLVNVETHLRSCAECQAQLAKIERGRAALDIAAPAPHRRAIAGAVVALAVAAALAGVAIIRSTPSGSGPAERWTTTTWSATAGYVTGGKAMIDIDAQLTRLERGWAYGQP